MPADHRPAEGAETLSPPTPPLRHVPAGITIGDIYYVLFRHKLKILLCAATGLILAAAAYRLQPPPFQSEAKLFIRYVSETKNFVPAGAISTAKSPDQRGETIMDSEMEIITSWDLARQVAEAVGPELILGPTPGPADVNRAAAVIKANLTVEAPLRSSVIRLVFRHPNPDLVPRVLRVLIERYLRMHLEIHRAVGVVGDFLTQETDQIRSRLAQTEDELRKARSKAGVTSIEDTKKIHTEQMATIRQQIFATQAELAERSSLLQEHQRRLLAAGPAGAPVPGVEAPVPPARVEDHRDVIARLGRLRRLEEELLTQFRAENSRVQDVRSQLAAAEADRAALEDEFPSLRRVSPGPVGAVAGPAAGPEIPAEAGRLAGLNSRLTTLNTQLAELRTEAAALDLAETAIVELQRKRELEEANFRYYSASLEQARIDEALGAGRVSNISQIQSPSPPARDRASAMKLYALLAGGGLVLGLGWAFSLEYYLDRTIKRPADVERLLGAPVFLSLPLLGKTSVRGAPSALPTPLGLALTGPADGGRSPRTHPLARFHETLRDQLITQFERLGVRHKPKLVAVTGLGTGAGVSTMAAGLACSLSEVGEGNVLLVDMTTGQESARHFVHGEMVCDLEQVLDLHESAQVEEKLYVVSGSTALDQSTRNLPQRFAKLAPRLKASTFDYIIFDLPPVSPTSITPRVAGYMDLLLLVVEAERTEEEVFHRAAGLLAATETPLGVVLNKTRTYVPRWLKQEFFGES